HARRGALPGHDARRQRRHPPALRALRRRAAASPATGQHLRGRVRSAHADPRGACDDRRVRWKLTERAGPKVRRSSFGDVDQALQALESRGRALADEAPDEAVDVKYKTFEAQQRVVARLELAGPERFVPSVRAGVDVRGDGSVEAFRGRVRREVIEERSGESTYAALRRALV